MRFFISRRTFVAIVASLLISTAVIVSAEDDHVNWSDEDIPSVPQTLKITNLLRTLDLSKSLIREVTSAALQNIATEAVSEYYVPLDQAYSDHIAYITAENRKTKEILHVTKDEKYSDPDFQYYKVKLSQPLTPGEKVQITVKTSLSNIIRPFPTHVGQAEKQRFVYFGNPFALTAYPASKQKTTVVTPNGNLEVLEHPEESALVVKANQVVLGPYSDVKALEHGIFEVQYELPGTVSHVRHLRRDVEISQWGNNLAVEEHINFVNKGAQLKGQFSRIDFQRNPHGIREGNGILEFATQIPKLARDIYYRDEIGNISTSTLQHHSDHIQFNLKPRFPLFGGWNTTWYTGYNVPLDGYLRKSAKGGDKYILKVPVFAPIKDTTYEEVEIRIVLPEGAKNVKLEMPFEVENIEHSTTKTYMDSAGRYTISIWAKNFIEEHAQDLFIEYEYSSSSYLTKPLAAATMLMILFGSSMVFSRLDFKIGGSTLKK
ncbi:proteasome regulatory particle base subunit [Gryganskiella cystojenkinii]|nr:proteasome regulatory particle base subunit [Gryganskiella cystojenkinii]